MKTKSKQLEWLQNEISKDNIEINKDKEIFIKEIKKYKKEDFFVTKKLTFWQKIKKIILG